MEQRWTIWHTEGTERRCVSQVMAAVSGPAVLAGAPVSVVPCDDAAIERAAIKLYQQQRVGRSHDDLAAILWPKESEVRREGYRDDAREMFRAAGETS